jgi:hypothetical protein
VFLKPIHVGHRPRFGSLTVGHGFDVWHQVERAIPIAECVPVVFEADEVSVLGAADGRPAERPTDHLAHQNLARGGACEKHALNAWNVDPFRHHLDVDQHVELPVSKLADDIHRRTVATIRSVAGDVVGAHPALAEIFRQ